MLRFFRFLLLPINLVMGRLFPVKYAKQIGVDIRGEVKIYGSSYYMFSTEPYLVSLGDNVYISIGVRFICHDGSTLPFRRNFPNLELADKIRVGNNVFIGTGALILQGVSIGNNCIIGANSVVTKSIPDDSVYSGNPAHFIKTTNDFLNYAKNKSLEIGNLTGIEKINAYKSIFNIKK